MKIIHTADWHLGNRMDEIDRNQEFSLFLEWLKQQISEQKAEALVVAGDIFDVANPGSEAQTLFYNFLAGLKNTCCKNIIIVGGNHDSGQRLEIAKALAEQSNIHIVGSINNLQPEDMIFELKDTEDKTCGICAAVPFVREIELINFLGELVDSTKAPGEQGFEALYSKTAQAALKLRSERKLPVIATGHLYASGLEGRLSEANPSEKTDDGVKVIDPLGNLGNIPVSVFPSSFDYVALGHIHYTTKVGKKDNVRYSGSPFVLGFDEAQLPRYILSVEFPAAPDEKQSFTPEIKKIKVPEFVQFKRLSGTITQLKEQLEEFKGKSFEKNVYLELCYKKEPGTDVRQELSSVMEALPEKVQVVSWKLMEQPLTLRKGALDIDSTEIKNIQSETIFTNLILEKLKLEKESEEGKAALKEYLPLFKQIEGEVEQELKERAE